MRDGCDDTNCFALAQGSWDIPRMKGILPRIDTYSTLFCMYMTAYLCCVVLGEKNIHFSVERIRSYSSNFTNVVMTCSVGMNHTHRERKRHRDRYLLRLLIKRMLGEPSVWFRAK